MQTNFGKELSHSSEMPPDVGEISPLRYLGRMAIAEQFLFVNSRFSAILRVCVCSADPA
jgi:hypothetical protein